MPRQQSALPRTSKRHAEQPGARPTIGYPAPRIGDNVSQALWSGVVDAARERGAHLICFAGKGDPS